jgi:hypothetical protein
MSKPLVTFPDPEVHQIDMLKAAFLPRSETYKPTGAGAVSPDFPTAALAGDATHVQVELEVGSAEDYPITERAQVRYTCYAAPGKRTNVKALASLTQALVYAQPGDADVAGAFILIGRSDVVTDPTTKNLMVWFLARVNLNPKVLA